MSLWLLFENVVEDKAVSCVILLQRFIFHPQIQLRDDNKLLRAKLEFLTGNYKTSLNLSRSFLDMPKQEATYRFKTLLAEVQFIRGFIPLFVLG